MMVSIYQTLKLLQRVWLLWYQSIYDIHVIQTSTKAIHALITVQRYVRMLFSGLYAYSHHYLRSPFWNEFHTISNNVNLPWLVMGILIEL